MIILPLICTGLYFTFRSHFVQFRKIKEMSRLLVEGVAGNNNKNAVSSFQAFCIATASRVGTGNLAGVATALALGGAGAVFWMWLIALIGSASAFVESTLAQIYKEKGKKSYIGGPAFYMKKGLKQKWMGTLFAAIIMVTFGMVFNSVQANTISLASGSLGRKPAVAGYFTYFFHSSDHIRRDSPDSQSFRNYRTYHGDCLYSGSLFYSDHSSASHPLPHSSYFRQRFRL